jgi:methionine-rich copper-binding protein CopC
MTFYSSNIHLVFIASLLNLLIQNCFAEGVLMESAPKDNAVISTLTFNKKITLAFSGNVSERTPSLVVVDSTGTRVDMQDATLVIGDRSILSASTIDLAPGRYAIRYRVVTKDGLIVSGISRFEIKA